MRDSGQSPEEVASAVGVSVRTVKRIWGETGTDNAPDPGDWTKDPAMDGTYRMYMAVQMENIGHLRDTRDYFHRMRLEHPDNVAWAHGEMKAVDELSRLMRDFGNVLGLGKVVFVGEDRHTYNEEQIAQGYDRDETERERARRIWYYVHGKDPDYYPRDWEDEGLPWGKEEQLFDIAGYCGSSSLNEKILHATIPGYGEDAIELAPSKVQDNYGLTEEDVRKKGYESLKDWRKKMSEETRKWLEEDRFNRDHEYIKDYQSLPMGTKFYWMDGKAYLKDPTDGKDPDVKRYVSNGYDAFERQIDNLLNPKPEKIRYEG